MSPSNQLGTLRAYVKDRLEPRIPEVWRFSDGIPTLDKKLNSPIVWLEYGEFAPLDGVPTSAGHVAAVLDICIATNRTDMRDGETTADDMVADLYHALIALHEFHGLTARKTVYEGAYYGWKMSVTIATDANDVTEAPEAPEAPGVTDMPDQATEQKE